ncbi:MAG: ABC transporter ATP-binding protein [Desulfatiglandales bacterium]
MKKVVEILSVSVSFGQKTLLENVDFSVYEREIFAIIGGSGSGKSTLLKLMTGLLAPSKGKILIHGRDLVQAGDEEYKRLMRRFGILFQNSGLIGSITVLKNVMLPLLHHTDLGEHLIEAIALEKLNLVGLAHATNLYPSQLSGGMRKRVGLARAMITDPDILFLDEPSSGLDPVSAASLDQLIVKLNRELGTTIIMVSHDLESIFKVAQRAILLDGKRKGIVAEGNPEELRRHSKDRFAQAFFNRLPLETPND